MASEDGSSQASVYKELIDESAQNEFEGRSKSRTMQVVGRRNRWPLGKASWGKVGKPGLREAWHIPPVVCSGQGRLSPHGRWKTEAEWGNSEERWDNRGKEWASLPSEGIKKDWRVKAIRRIETRLPKPLQKLGDQNGKLLRRRLQIKGVPVEGGEVTKGGSPRNRWLVCPFPSLQPREALVLFWIRGMSWCLGLSGSRHPPNSRS